jgi:hypothetical protein
MAVDTIGFNSRGWLDTYKGHPQTESLHVTERFRRPNGSYRVYRSSLSEVWRLGLPLTT